ncbi:STAS domain-containing protein [Alteribacter natronophilus]|uniref:STAS domain-containing protein n=1 Tax=Alteribacter natronophilus TaxID=2583810 RepID=UPI001486ED3B|nr:STAS domain-containing protein [Alteribacter natronophilus]
MVCGNDLIKLGEAVKENSLQMSRDLYEEYDAKYEFDHHFSLSKDELIAFRQEFFDHLGEGLITEDVQQVGNNVYHWAKEAGRKAVRGGLSADMAMMGLSPVRKVVHDLLREEFRNFNFGIDMYFDVFDRLNPLIDKAVYSFAQAYTEYNEETFSHAQEELLELSVPIVPLTDSVALLPVVGTIDTYRSKKMLDQALEQGNELGLDYLIIDLSGVHMIDTAVAHNLFQLHDALKIIGVTAIISGLRPELAQTIVNLGISFKHMNVTSRLEQALEKTGLVIQSENDVPGSEIFDAEKLKA